MVCIYAVGLKHELLVKLFCASCVCVRSGVLEGRESARERGREEGKRISPLHAACTRQLETCTQRERERDTKTHTPGRITLAILCHVPLKMRFKRTPSPLLHTLVSFQSTARISHIPCPFITRTTCDSWYIRLSVCAFVRASSSSSSSSSSSFADLVLVSFADSPSTGKGRHELHARARSL